MTGALDLQRRSIGGFEEGAKVAMMRRGTMHCGWLQLCGRKEMTSNTTESVNGRTDIEKHKCR